MGKATQFGTVEEVLALSREVDGVAPCIDFAHLHARTGACNSDEGFAAVFEQVRKALGRKSLAEMHIHVSGIDYGPKGERKHLNFKEADFRYRKFLRAAMDYNVKGFIICESPILEKDAVLLQKAYRALERAARSED
jgi:deoxyribonuclease-4